MTIRAFIVATRRRSPGRAVAAAMAVAAVTGAITAGTAHAVAARTEPAAAAAAPRAMKSACPPPGPGYMRCFALFAPQTAVNAAIAAGVTGAAARPRGWGAKAIKSAYKLPTSRNPHEEVAVVEAYDTPNLASDVAAYRTEYGLPTLHHRQRLPPQGQPEWEGIPAARIREVYRLGFGGNPGRGHGLGGLP